MPTNQSVGLIRKGAGKTSSNFLWVLFFAWLDFITSNKIFLFLRLSSYRYMCWSLITWWKFRIFLNFAAKVLLMSNEHLIGQQSIFQTSLLSSIFDLISLRSPTYQAWKCRIVLFYCVNSNPTELQGFEQTEPNLWTNRWMTSKRLCERCNKESQNATRLDLYRAKTWKKN